jgi:hypothetical protein
MLKDYPEHVRLVNFLKKSGYEVAASMAGQAWQLGIRL